MTSILIGSCAARHHFPRHWRDPRDVDLFTDEPSDPDIPIEGFWHESLRDWFRDDQRVATVNELYTIKVSHAAWELGNGSWDKHMFDIVALQDLGCTTMTLLPTLYDILYKVWEEKHGKKKLNLNMDYEEFFTDNVRRIYDHDSIHEAVCYQDRPAYERYLSDADGVSMDMSKVWADSHNNIVQLFREEVLATALERYLIPHDFQYSSGLAYRRALKKTITSLTKGKSALFMIENYRDFMDPDRRYVERFHRNHDRLREFGTRAVDR